ncbi:MAG: hemagglutinin repeat-containing protein [Variovorax sp.]|nr:hemagglutinin repeat-containing protein [Variovorax sp.]
MNHVYRIVWNNAVHAWVAVAETARGRGKSSKAARPAAVALAAVLGAGIAHAQAIPSVTVAPGQQTNAYVSGNGVTVVNIANPNAAGLSHNRYQQFNVNASGLVLNNTTTQQISYSSQLAGQIMANQNTANTASVILNEVISNNRSTLAGFTEVLGRKADVVLANPYGITCSGCGFINTDRVTLSTGLPFMRADGSLGGFNVSQGDILVTGTGLNATAQQVLDLVARSVRIDGAINAQDLSIAAGTNQWDYGTRAVTGSVGAQGTAPTYAIDSSALGGMYANRIKLTATEAGVGVRMLGDAAASADDFTLTAAGRVEMNNKVSAQRDVMIASTSNDVAAIALTDANIAASRNIGIAANQGGTKLTGGAIVAGSDLAVSAQSLIDAASASGSNTRSAGGSLNITTDGAATLGATQWAAGNDAHITAGEGFDNAGTLSANSGAVQIRAGKAIGNTGTITAATSLDIADNTGGQTQSLTNSGDLVAGSTLTIAAAAVDNAATGRIKAGTGTSINAASLNNAGTWLLSEQAGGSDSIAVSGQLSNSGKLQSNGSASLSAGDLTNSGMLLADGKAALHTDGTLQNSGTIQSAQDIEIADRSGAGSENIINTGKLLTAGALSVRATAITNAPTAGDPQSGWVQAANGTRIDASSLDNSGTWLLSQQAGAADQITLNGAMTNAGTLQSAGGLNVAAASASNQGVLVATDALTANLTGDFSNGTNAVAQSGGDLTITSGGKADIATGGGVQTTAGNLRLDAAQGLTNAGVLTAKQGSTTVRANGTITNTGTINAATTLDIADRSGTGSENLDNNGLLLAGKDLKLKAATITNQAANGWVQAAEGSTVEANTLTNDGTWVLSTQDTGVQSSVKVTGTLTNSGILQAQQDAALTANRIANQAGAALRAGRNLNTTAGAGDYDNAGTVQAGGTLTIGGTNTALTNQSGGKLLGDGLQVNVASIDNSGTIQGGQRTDSTVAASGTLTNRASGVITAGTSNGSTAGAGAVSATRIVNDGKLQSAGQLTVSVGSSGLTSNGDILANDALKLQALSGNYSATINGTLQSGAELRVTGGTGSTLSVGQGKTARGASVYVDTGTVNLNNGATLASDGNLNFHAGTLTLGDSTTRVLAALGGTGTGTVSVDNALTNNGLIFSATSLGVSAPSITNGLTGGIAALGNLGVTATTGNLMNQGSLYAGGTLTAKAVSGTLTNAASASAYQGTINADGAVVLQANSVVNNSTINSLGSVQIDAQTIRNAFATDTTRAWGAEGAKTVVETDHMGQGYNGCGCVDQTEAWYYTATWIQDQYYVGGAPNTNLKPQIIGAGQVNLTFQTGENLGGVISGNVVNLTGQTGTATFTNDDLSLLRRTYTDQYQHYIKYKAAGPLKYTDDSHYASNVTHADSTLQSIGAGIYANTLNASGFSLINAGSPWQATSKNQSTQTAASGTQSGTVSGVAASGTQSFGGLAGASTATAISLLGFNAANGINGNAFGGIRVALPTNPNGFYVTTRDPGAKYLVETNPLYMTGSSSMGSEYLAKLLGYNPDELGMRLGDASYEAYLVKQQLIAQTGGVILARYQSADAQMQGLMESAATESKSLGLEYGKALTPEQQASLKQDMVWMVATQIDGKVVLAPVVYLAKSTKDNIATGAVISAQDANMSLTALTNTGGTIVGSKTLAVTSTGDITNLSGTIKGGDVSLTSTNGSIVNKTVSEGSGGDKFYQTTIGKTAGIESTGALSLDAKKDITNIGATMNAGTDASLKAGGNVTFDTIENKTTGTTQGAVSVPGGSGWTSTTTTTVQQVKSGLTVGGNLSVDAGKDITLAGTDAKVGGNADLKAGGDLNIIARENSTTTHTESKSAGVGMNNSLFGTSSTTTDSLSVRNVGSSLQVGGNANLTAGKDVTVQGSDVNVKGNGTINATNVNVLAGRNYDETHTTTTNTGVMQVSSSAKGSAGADASADSSSGRGRASASAEASANAAGTGAAGLAFGASTTTTTDTTDLRHVGSNLNFGGDVTINASKDVNLQGSTVNAGGNATVNAQNVNLLAAEDKKTSTTTTTSTSVGLMASTDNKAEAGASAGAQAAGGKGTPSAGAQAGAQASAESENHLDLVQHTTSTTNTLDTTHQGSAINSGGNLTVNASNNLTLEGSSMKSGGDMTLNATDMTFKAVNDVHEVSTSSSKTTAGLYATGKADASADAGAQAGLGAQAGAKAEASASIEVGLYGSNTTSSSVDGSTNAVTSSLSSGGNINRTATNSINDQGTQIEGAGNLNQSARTITSTAAADTTYSSSNSTTHTAKVGAYAEASAGASADASVGPGAGKPGGTETDAGAGIRASYQYDNSSESSNSSNAVVSTIKMGGSVNSKSSGTTSLEGTQISAGKDVSLEASSLDYKAAQNTSSSTSKSTSAGASVGVDLVKKEASVGVNYDGSNSSSSSSTAVVGGIQAGGNLSVKTTGDTRLEGTNLSAGGAASIDAGGKVDFAAAKNTASSSSQQVGVDVGVTAGKSGGSGSVGVGVSESKSSLNEDVAGSIKSDSGPLTIKSGGDANFTGTQISSQQGDVSVNAGGAINFNAARKVESSSSVAVDVSASASAGKKENVGGTRNATTGNKTGGETMDERSGSASLGVGTSKSNSDTATGGSITSGGGSISLKSGGNTTLEGTQVKAANGVSADAGGSFVQKDAKSTSNSETVGFSASASGSSLTPEKKKTGTTTSAPAPAPKPSTTTAPSPAPAPATTAAKAPASPYQQQKGSGIVDVYVDNQKSSSSQATTIDGGAGGVVIKQGTAGSK